MLVVAGDSDRAVSETDLQTLCVLPCSVKEEDLQIWSMKFWVCGAAHGYGNILDRNIPVPTPEMIAKRTGEKPLQQAEEISTR